MLGDTRTAALVSRDGSIDWLCWPRYDADPLFGRLLDAPGGGHFRFWVKGGRAAARAYHERSPVLETSINAPGGKARLVDAMPFRRRQGPIVVRRLECMTGRLEPMLEYAPARRGLTNLVGWKDEPLQAGESITVVLTDRGDDYPVDRALRLVQRSERWWNEWCAQIRPGTTHADLLIRSLITLRLLTYTPSGAPVAAPTTSLPEEIGGVRNWDYRYAWPRDASVGVAAMISTGHADEAERFLGRLVHQSREPASPLRQPGRRSDSTGRGRLGYRRALDLRAHRPEVAPEVVGDGCSLRRPDREALARAGLRPLGGS